MYTRLGSLKSAVYLDEVSQYPQEACEHLRNLQIDTVVLRSAWGGPVVDLNDANLALLRSILSGHGINALMLSTTSEDLDRILQVGKFLNVSKIRFVGRPTKQWLSDISAACIRFDVCPLFEICKDYLSDMDMFDTHMKWKFIFDPSQLQPRKSVDLWHRYKSRCDILELHDFRAGMGHKPVGYGDTNILQIIKDALLGGFSGWFVLESGLGARYKDTVGTKHTFNLALEAVDSVLENIND